RRAHDRVAPASRGRARDDPGTFHAGRHAGDGGGCGRSAWNAPWSWNPAVDDRAAPGAAPLADHRVFDGPHSPSRFTGMQCGVYDARRASQSAMAAWIASRTEPALDDMPHPPPEDTAKALWP